MAIADDFTVTTGGNIRHASGTTHYTVLELHRWLQDLADQAQASGNDLIDITTTTPSERSTDNIITLLGTFNIDDDASEYFYNGSITQGSGDIVYSGLKVLGACNSSTTQIMVIQDNALYSYTTTPSAPYWGTQSTGGYNGDSASGILMQVMLKTRVGGADIDLKKVRVQSRHWGDTYDFFNVALGQGVSVAALGTTPDAQNDTAEATVEAWAGGDIPTNVEGYQQIDIGDGNGDQPYYSKWTYNTNALEMKAIWEWGKDITGTGTSATIHGLNGYLYLGPTHEIIYDNQDASEFFTEDETISWGSGVTAGTGICLADTEAGVDAGVTGTMWIQLVTGIAPTDGLVLAGATCNADVNGTPSILTVPKVFLGSYTGSLIGAFGIGVDPDDLLSTDTVADLDGDTNYPPNNVTFSVSGLVSGEDYILIGPKDTGDDFEFDQLTSNAVETTNLVAAAFLMSAAIPTDTPASGSLRVKLASGIYAKVPYASYTGSTFTVTYDFTSDNSHADKHVMVSYVDVLADATSEAFTTVFSSSRSLWIRVRDGGAASPIKTYESQGTLASTGGSAVASRITDE